MSVATARSNPPPPLPPSPYDDDLSHDDVIADSRALASPPALSTDSSTGHVHDPVHVKATGPGSGFGSMATSPTLSSVSGGPSFDTGGQLSLSATSTPYSSRKVLSPRSSRSASVYSSPFASRSRSVSGIDGPGGGLGGLGTAGSLGGLGGLGGLGTAGSTATTTCRKCGNTPKKESPTPRRTSCELFIYDGPVEGFLKSEGLDSFGNSEASYDVEHEYSSMLSRAVSPHDHERLKEFTALAIDQRDSKLHKQRKHIQRLSVDLSRLSDDFYRSNEYMRESDDKLAKLNMQLSTMRRRAGDAEGRATVLEERVDWFKLEVKRLEDELEKAHTERRKAFSAKLAVYHDVEQAKKELTKTQAELRTKSTQLQEAEARVMREVEPLKRKAEELEKQLEEKEVESYDLQETSSSLRIELSRREEAIISLHAENSSLRSGAGIPEALTSALSTPRAPSRSPRHLAAPAPAAAAGTTSRRKKGSAKLSVDSIELNAIDESAASLRAVSFDSSARHSFNGNSNGGHGAVQVYRSQSTLAEDIIRAAERIRKEWSPIKKPELRHALSSELTGDAIPTGMELVRRKASDASHDIDVLHEGRLPTLTELGLLTVAVLVNTGYEHGCAVYDRLAASRLLGCFCRRRKRD